LSGLRVVELASIGPGPFACMLLSDMGADVVTVERPGKELGDRFNILGRGRRVVFADLKNEAERSQVLSLVDKADVLAEGVTTSRSIACGLCCAWCEAATLIQANCSEVVPNSYM
jgi:crotonobetainyl-CoA:carnitine CoA-transferase CaiB-like acyl-CoA transferase